MDAAALADIHSAFAQPVSWQQDAVSVDVTAIPFNDRGDDPIGVGASVRKKGFEVPYSSLPFEPRYGDILTETESGHTWRVIDYMDYDEALAWRVQVESAA